MSDAAKQRIRGFVHLRVHSAYSLLKGALKIPKIIDLCKEYQMPAVALTDCDNLFGALEFSEIAMKSGIQPIIGLTVRVAPYGSEQAGSSTAARTQTDELLLYAKDEIGLANLFALSSKAYLSPETGNSPVLTYDEIARYSDGLIALTAGQYGAVGKMLLASRHKEATHALTMLREMFPSRLYIELMRHGLAGERAIERPMIDFALEANLPLVATNNVYFAHANMYDAHDALLCVSEGRYVSETDRPRLTPEHRFKSPEEMRLLFRDIPEALANTLHIAERCHTFAPSRSPILPGFRVTSPEGDVLSESDALRTLAHAGLQKRLAAHVFTDAMTDDEKEQAAKPYIERLDFELDVIITMKFPGYFLIVSDFITWSKEQGIPVGPGRGSGAGSVVAWVLLITDLDPLRYGLIFERFLNPERVSMPDFDIDFCQDRRDEVIRYVQQKYGHDRVAQIITFGKLQARAVLRDVGRVLQMPYSQVDRICKLVPNNPANPMTLEQAILAEPLLRQAIREDDQVDRMVTISKQLEGLYRHASTHAAGVVIGDRPLQELVPMYRDPKSDMPVVQYSMKYAEAAGLVKFDFLGLKTLTVLQKTMELLAQRGITLNLDTLPEGDKATYALLSRGDTVGVFQFESAGMQDALRKLKPDCIEDLIALGALYRPGPMDNIPTYIARKHGREKPDYLHPMLEEVLKETYGVIIYQEQVQKIAQVLSGYTLGAADLLRRAMGKKIKAEMDAQRAIFVAGAKANNVNEAQASSIFELVAKFAGYGFNKSHAAAYAVIAYQTAYLKANYPVEFLAASMTYDMGATDKLSIFRQEAQKMGVKLLPPDVNASQVLFSVETCADGTHAIRYGLAATKNVGAGAMAAIIEAREEKPYSDIFDFARRVDASVLNRRQVEHLVMAGAFDSMHANRHQLFASLDRILSLAQQATADRSSNQSSLFGGETGKQDHSRDMKQVDEWPMIEKLTRECDAIGFFLSAHPLESYHAVLMKHQVVSSSALSQKLSAQAHTLKVAGIVSYNKVKISPRGKFSFLGLSDEAGNMEVSIFDEQLLSRHHEWLEAGTPLLLSVEGKIVDGNMRLTVQKMERLDTLAASHHYTKITLSISESVDIARLKQALGAETPQGTLVECTIPTHTGLVRVRLKQRYKVNSSVWEALQSVPNLAVAA
jgi:DNA polymerase-3 subunit alpha